jgi:hypothetical protein
MKYVLLLRRVDLPNPIAETFADEGEARERWRETALAAIVGTPVNGHLITSARLYVGSSIGSKHDAHRLACAGHLRLLESSHPMTSPAQRERVTA